jgi:hypothetical protein
MNDRSSIATNEPEPLTPCGDWPGTRPDAKALQLWLEDRAPLDSKVPASAIALTRQRGFATAADEVKQMDTEGYRPRESCAAVRIDLPANWCMDPLGDRNWRMQLNMLRLIDPFLRAYEQTGETHYLRRAFAICLDWGRFHRDTEHGNPFAWVDMAVGVRAQRLAYLTERLRAGIFETKPQERAAFARLLADHWKRLTANGFFKYTNHTIIDIHGLTALVRTTLPEAADRPAWEASIGRHLDRLIAIQFDEHGVHRENSPAYQFVARNMFRVLQRSKWYSHMSPTLEVTLKRAEAVEDWMRMPDGRRVAIGDTDGEAPLSTSTPLTCSPESPGRQTTSLNHSGYCFIRSSRTQPAGAWSFLGIKAGFDVNTHRHNDEMSFVWAESGWDIVVDAGKYSYDNDDMRAFARSARAHNVIEFDNRDSNTEESERTGHLIRQIHGEEWGARMAARWTHEPMGVSHRRVFYFAAGRWLVLRDDFVSLRTLPFVHRTHLAPEFTVRLDAGAFSARHSSGAVLAVHTWSSVPVEHSLHRGTVDPLMEGWISRRYRDKEPTPTLALRGRASAGTLIMALSLDTDARLAVTEDARALWTTANYEVPVEPHGL